MKNNKLTVSIAMLTAIVMTSGFAFSAFAYQGNGESGAGANMLDSNDNGIPDGQEDFDGDGVLNKEDIDYEKSNVNMRDDDGDGVANKDDEDFVAPQDGTGIQAGVTSAKKVGDGSRDGEALRQGEAKFENQEMYSRVKGKIIVKPEDEGRAYYVNPSNGMMRSLGRPADAFAVMREEGLGISNADFELWDGIAPENLAGKILLKVEDLGQAYYVNPDTLEMIFLNRPSDAFKVMRDLGLGVSNDDFDSFFVAE